jgi:outer membrane protein
MTRHVVVILAIMVAAADAAAQERLSLDAAVQAALSDNASIRAARAGTREAEANARQARSGWFPRISAAESWQRGDQPVFVFSSLLSARRFGAANFAIDALNHPDAIGFFRTSVGLEQQVFDGGRQRSASKAARLQQDIADASADEAIAGIALAVTEAFGRVLAADAGRAAAGSALTAAREDLVRIERRRSAGMATDADVLDLTVRVADLQQREIRAEGDRAVARAELSRLMGAPVGRDFEVAEPVSAEGAMAFDLPALLAEADASRPELRRAARSRELAEARRREARASLIPQVAAQAAFDVGGTRFDDRASSWLVGGEVRWTFSLGGAERARLDAAGQSVIRAAAELEAARAAVHVDVITALRQLESARARQAVGRAAADQSRESQRIIRNRFDAGVASVNDVLRASTAVLDAESARTAALVDVVIGEAMLRRALGRAP